ncbi:cytidine deaminase [Candidatus Halobonum tyrrellensis]|uniref:cytidine deaminase n=1 Tax=Candidatus Halobonum tyrrellensis G22 TaxID=1324957 RepID=V4GUB4_9EURY|nr:cytidine deaminase [Candidatus Halobonum tyrrellensis]ESP88726.1 cytidine deaminase [Candidatus Halobonum tyrrellensis G22]
MPTTPDADPADDPLVSAARDALSEAYVPYSEYPVGAALETEDGSVFTGCNVENANYSNSLHAEEVAVGKAVSAGHDEFARLAVTSEARDGVTPCGMCRQTLAEFGDDDMPVVCDGETGLVAYTLGELLPNTIGLDTLEDAAAKRRDAGAE